MRFISFDDIRENPDILKDIDVILNVGGAYTAYSGGENWADEKILTAVKRFVYEGGGFIGVGEPTACQREGRYFQLSGVMGVEKENGFTLNVDKYNWEEHEQYSLLPMISEMVVVYISAAFLTALRTADFSTEPSSGHPMMKKTCINGSPQIIT